MIKEFFKAIGLIVTTLTIFGFDYYGEPLIPFGVLYCFVILYSWSIEYKHAVVYLASVSSYLIIFAFIYQYSNEYKTILGINMILSLVVVWVSAALMYLAKNVIYHIEISRQKLNKEVENKTFHLSQKQERITQMVNVVKDYTVILLDKNGFIKTWNEGAQNINHYKKEEIIGKAFSIFFTQESRLQSQAYTLLDEAKKNGSSTFNGTLVRKDNSRYPAQTIVTAIFDKNNKHTGYTNITKDLTNEYNLALAKEKELDLIVQNRELEKFAFYISHDLQEPLRTIESFVEILKEDYQSTFETKASEYLDILSNSSHRLREMINGLLSYSRLGKSYTIEEVNFNELVTCIQENLTHKINKKQALFHVEKLHIVNGYKALLEQLITNLLTNAIKFVTQDTQPIITICSTEREHDFLFEIKDNGIGIADKYKEQIFEPFNRLHPEHIYAGTGIGLAQCQRIVDIHKGKIWIESKLKKGTTFFFTINKTIKP